MILPPPPPHFKIIIIQWKDSFKFHNFLDKKNIYQKD